MPTINDPVVIAEVTACCEAYERALVANDVAALQGFFWDSPLAIRFGLSEQLYGADAISAFRQNRVINFRNRRVFRFELLALGADTAVAMLEYEIEVAAGIRQGRQTQMWARFPEIGWRITSAHVSLPLTNSDPALVQALATAKSIGLEISPDHRAGTLTNLARNAQIAAPLLAFQIPDEIEPTSVFTA